MVLTLNDKREISQIIASFTDEDYERINSEVDRLCKRCDPISEMLRSYKPDEHTKDAKYQSFDQAHVTIAKYE